jgi:hypothetical protein
MLKNNINRALCQCGIYRLLFLLFLAVFFIYPIADAAFDAQTDYLDHSSAINDIDDDYSGDNHDAFYVLKHASQNYHAAGTALFHQPSAACDPVIHIFDRKISATVVKTSQTSPTLASDPSPPLS